MHTRANFFRFSFSVKVCIRIRICGAQEGETVNQAGIPIFIITKNFIVCILAYVNCLISTAYLKLSHSN